MSESFKALVVRESTAGIFTRAIEERSTDDLPPGEVLVRVSFSALNYKDALSAHGHKGVTRRYPHTPGVDAAGTVAVSSVDAFSTGDEVVVTGYDLGMNTPGGFGQYIRVPAEWVVPQPEAFTLREAALVGTAGFTVAQCLEKLERNGLEPGAGEVLVTGATGGVGSLAVAILAKAGYRVAASTGKADQEDWLKQIGAARVVGRSDVSDRSDSSDRPMLKARWAAAIDTVGGTTLASIIKTLDYRGSVACCGLVESPGLATTVYPFLLRGINLLGIDSAACPREARLRIWEKLAGDWRPGVLDELGRDVVLEALDPEIDRILRGGQVGRVVVSLD